MANKKIFSFTDIIQGVPLGDVEIIIKLNCNSGDVDIAAEHGVLSIITIPALSVVIEEEVVTTEDAYTFGGYIADNDSYNEAGDSWANKTDMSLSAVDHNVTSINSKCYIFSFAAGAATKNCEEYTPTTDAYASKTTSPDPPRYMIAANTISDKGYVYNGRDDNVVTTRIQDCDEYDAGTNAWASKTDTPAPARRILTAVTLSDKGYIQYGEDASGRIKDNDEFDAAGNSWANKTDGIDPARYNHGVFALSDKSYCVGGTSGPGVKMSDNDEYDPATDGWTAKTNIPGNAMMQLGACPIGTHGYKFCGYSSATENVNHQYDSAANTWALMTVVPIPARYENKASAI